MQGARPRPLVLAHRGDHTRARENTLPAFAAARAAGTHGVELDVRRTADGGLVVHHDPEASGVGLLASSTLSEARKILAWLPTLGEALDECEGMLVNVEIKDFPHAPDIDVDERVAVDVVALLRDRGLRDDVVVSSFMLPTIDRVRDLEPSVATAWLTLAELEPLAALETAHERGHGGLHPHWQALRGADVLELVRRADELGVEVRPWTVDTEEEIERLAAANIHGLITDRPATALRLLRNDQRE